MEYKEEIKNIGTWDLKDATELDNLAYYLYCSNVYDDNNNGSGLFKGMNQFVFKAFSDIHNIYESYYHDVHLILRSEKIDRIKNKINDL